MPGIIKVRVIEARDLPVMDRSSMATDAYVEVKFADESFRTHVCKKTLRPVWNADFRFEADDVALQDEPLELKVWDQDTISADDTIGKVYIDLNPLLMWGSAQQIAGWFPIYDTLRGIQGEVNVVVKVHLFKDVNRFRDTSCEVQFFGMPVLPPCYRAVAVHGFVEELVVNDDPEHQFRDNFRTSRASNEARQKLFSRLSGELQRKIGKKVLEMDGNAVVGFQQSFDLEGGYGMVCRGIGTACTLVAVGAEQFETTSEPESPNADGVAPAKEGAEAAGDKAGSFPNTNAPVASRYLHPAAMQRHVMPKQETPLLTLRAFPPGFLVSIGGIVSARSIKLLDKIHNPDEPETRDAWWNEVRDEIRSNARAIGCHAVVAYSESSCVCGELFVLSAQGTAARINAAAIGQDGEGVPEDEAPESADAAPAPPQSDKGTSLVRRQSIDDPGTPAPTSTPRKGRRPPGRRKRQSPCSLCHIPYRRGELPYNMRLTKCAVCRRKYVPEVIFATAELPPQLKVVGQGCLLEARVCRVKRKAQGEANATAVSEAVPFLEYDMHRQLMTKLKIKGMNALFGARMQVTVGEEMIIGVATATAVYLAALPSPPPVQITRNLDVLDEEDAKLVGIQRRIMELSAQNREQLSVVPESPTRTEADGMDSPGSDSSSSSSSSEDDDAPGNPDRTAFVMEIDDETDEDTMAVLLDPPIPANIGACSTWLLPSDPPASPVCNLQLVTAVRRVRIDDKSRQTNQQFAGIFHQLQQSLWFKVRALTPCTVSGVWYDVQVPDDDDIQVTVSAVVAGLPSPQLQQALQAAPVGFGTAAVPLPPVAQSTPSTPPPRTRTQRHLSLLSVGSSQQGTPSVPVTPATADDDSGMIFPMETDESRESTVSAPAPQQLSRTTTSTSVYATSHRNSVSEPPSYRPYVELTPLPFVPGCALARYLGHIDLYLIKESTSVREAGGMGAFVRSFVTEAQAIARAHVTALGGNALLAYQLDKVLLLETPNRNQAYCLLILNGDVAEVARMDGAQESVGFDYVSKLGCNLQAQ